MLCSLQQQSFLPPSHLCSLQQQSFLSPSHLCSLQQQSFLSPSHPCSLQQQLFLSTRPVATRSVSLPHRSFPIDTPLSLSNSCC